MVLGAMPKIQARDTATFGLAVIALVALAGACGEGDGGAPCLPEDVERCKCEDGRPGFFVCDPEGGTGYGACTCDLDASPYLPEAGVEAAVPDGGGGEGGEAGGLAFMDPCSTAPGAPKCPPGDTCFDFPAKGPHCSHPCSVATDCPPPSPGCNNQGECKSP
jgi:hypothetical protein